MLYSGTPLRDYLSICGQLGRHLEAPAHAGSGNPLTDVCLPSHGVPAGNCRKGVASEHDGGDAAEQATRKDRHFLIIGKGEKKIVAVFS